MVFDRAFSFLDGEGNSLRFESFRHQYPTGATDYHDTNWLHCRITIQARVEHSVEGFLLTHELQDLAETLRAALAATQPSLELTFEPIEPYVSLRFSRNNQNIDVLSRLDLSPCLGPVIEYKLECRAADVVNTLAELERLIADFPVLGERPR